MLFRDIANSTARAERRGAETMHTILNQLFDLALGQVQPYDKHISSLRQKLLHCADYVQTVAGFG